MNNDYKVLVVEDEMSINDILSSALRSEGYSVRSAFSGEEARMLLKTFNPSIALLDINLPDESGFDICKDITRTYSIPIIMLTARTDIVDKILGLELGADDYITKPFHIKEVLARVKNALKRIDKYKYKSEDKFVLLTNNIKINYESRCVYKNNELVKLKPREYDLLEYLSKNKDKVFSRDTLLTQIWGFDYDGDERTVDVHVRRLRSKLDDKSEKSLIETVFSVGYVMRYNNEN
ncbi:response regulator transcription factor [Clostridium sp. SHJSY1]|uniref:response regulator transcription factor n=1 Tax=Clostridium sp. SHJSY1 TaxID=2942483 RepID=UPI002875CAD5|nr:response regulator transcription factor [Clostridium sp. SHJSY1]MDS0527196.1 response regulator transcription factor [Clostridium sp. SHJSY1]